MGQVSLRDLVQKYTRGEIARDEYRKSRSEMINEILAKESTLRTNTYPPLIKPDDEATLDITERSVKKEPLKTPGPAAAAPAPEVEKPPTKFLNPLLIAGALVLVVIVLVVIVMILPGHTPQQEAVKPVTALPPVTSKPEPSITAPARDLIGDFLEKDAWDNNSMDEFLNTWHALSEMDRQSIKGSMALNRLTNAIYTRLQEERAIVALDTSTAEAEADISRQESLVFFARQLGIKDDRITVQTPVTQGTGQPMVEQGTEAMSEETTPIQKPETLEAATAGEQPVASAVDVDVTPPADTSTQTASQQATTAVTVDKPVPITTQQQQPVPPAKTEPATTAAVTPPTPAKTEPATTAAVTPPTPAKTEPATTAAVTPPAPAKTEPATTAAVTPPAPVKTEPATTAVVTSPAPTQTSTAPPPQVTAAAPSTKSGNCNISLLHSRRPYCRDIIDGIGNGPTMVIIPPGKFMMGGDRSDEQPRHNVVINNPFAMSVHEITYGEYQQFCKDTNKKCPTQPWAGNDYPVVNVSWNDATAYAEWLSEKTGQHYRLPSESEWEYAARGGTQTIYPFGDTINISYAVFSERKALSSPLPKTDRTINRNKFRLYHIVGNVREWVADTWDDNYKGAPADGSPRTDGDKSMRIVRGGSYQDNAEALRSAARQALPANTTDNYTGFRIIQDL